MRTPAEYYIDNVWCILFAIFFGAGLLIGLAIGAFI